jgi:hypothetical protein
MKLCICRTGTLLFWPRSNNQTDQEDEREIDRLEWLELKGEELERVWGERVLGEEEFERIIICLNLI